MSRVAWGLALSMVLCLSAAADWIRNGVKAEPRAEMAPTNIVGSGAASGAVVSNDVIYLNVPDLSGAVAGLGVEDGELWDGVNENRDNIYLVEFRRAAGDSATGGEMLGGYVDGLEDTNGIDQVVLTNAVFKDPGYSFKTFGPGSPNDDPLGILGWWTLDDNAGSTDVVDSGPSNWTVIVATANTSTMTTNGTIDGALVCGSGLSGLPHVEGGADWNLQNYPELGPVDHSVCFWARLEHVNTTNWGDYAVIYSMGQYVDYAKSDMFACFLKDGGTPRFHLGGWYTGGGTDWPEADFPVGQWIHWGFAWDGSNCRVYTNGALCFEHTYNFNWQGVGEGPLRFGDGPDYLSDNADSSFSFDDIVIVRRTLTQEEVQFFMDYSAPSGGAMHLQANPIAQTYSPDEIRGMVLLDSTNMVNTEVVMDVSNDGSAWDRLALADLGPYSGSIRVYGATTNTTGIGSNLVSRIITTTNATGFVRGLAIMGR